MKHLIVFGWLVGTISVAAGCAYPPREPETNPNLGLYKAQIARTEANNLATLWAIDAERIDETALRLEEQTVEACRATLGLVPAMGTTKEHMAPASARFAELRKAGLKLSFEPVPNPAGGPPMYQLVDDVIINREAGRRMLETRSPELLAEFQRRQPFMPKLMDLSAQARQSSANAMLTAVYVIYEQGQFAQRLDAQLRLSKETGKPLDGQARDAVRRGLARLKRLQLIGATATGTFAAYQAAAAGRDPSAIDVIHKAALATFPTKAYLPVSEEEIQAAIDRIPEELSQQKQRDAALIRRIVGNAVYEQKYKGREDSFFGRQRPMGAGGMGLDAMKAAVAAAESPPPSAAAARSSGQGVELRGAKATAEAEASLDELLPKGGPVRATVQAVTALSSGDYKTALLASVELVPVGGGVLKDGLAIAMKLLKL